MKREVITEVIRQVWDANGDGCIEVRPDFDGLQCVVICTPDKKSQDYFGKFEVLMVPEIARHLGEALIAAAKDAQPT